MKNEKNIEEENDKTEEFNKKEEDLSILHNNYYRNINTNKN